MLTIIFLLAPFKQIIFHDSNVTTRPLLHKVEYYIDIDKYYFPILIHGYLIVIIVNTSIIAADAIFVTFVQHACGLFIVTRWVVIFYFYFKFICYYSRSLRIERAMQQKKYLTGSTDPAIEKDKMYQNMVQCICDHKTTMRYMLFGFQFFIRILHHRIM